MVKSSCHPIDVVITWVNGNDPVLNAKRQHHLSDTLAADATCATRFASNDEIYFCIGSILKNLPDCGKIYVVTDGQKPEFLDEFANAGLCAADKIQVIDHQILFAGYECYLPVFNSLSIEAMLWNIPQLSNQFIYLNDDVFLNALVQREDCFIDDKVVIYGHWKRNGLLKAKYVFRKFLNNVFGKTLQPRFSIAQMLSADLVGLSRYYELDHRPHFIQADILRSYFQEHPEILTKQVSFKFRDFHQFLPVGLMNHLSILQQRAILKADVPIAYTKPYADMQQFKQALVNSQVQYGCIQSLDEMPEVDQQLIRQSMIEKFGLFLPKVIQQRNA